MKNAPLLLTLGLFACPQPKPVTPDPPKRCQVALDSLELFSKTGSGAKATLIDAEVVGGASEARAGDISLANDKVQVVIQQPGRSIRPHPFGGALIDAEQTRTGRTSRDALGKIGLVYSFGRSVKVDTVEILEDGTRGGYAVVAATGRDARIDTFDVANVLTQAFGDVTLRSDPRTELPLFVTTYYVLSPGESRVRVLTAFCNEGRETITTAVGDLIEAGPTVERFNPDACTGTMGLRGCLVDPSSWFGLQADGVAYGYRSYSFRDRKAVATNAVLSAGDVIGVLAEGKDREGLRSWTSASGEPQGSFTIAPADPRLFLRDLFIETDLARVRAAMLGVDVGGRSRLDVTVLDAAGQPAPNARIAVIGAESGKPVTVAIADTAGKARFDVPVGNYRVATGAIGTALLPPVDVSAPANGEAPVTLRQGTKRTITINVKDPFNRPIPARVVVRCPSGICPHERLYLLRFFDLEVLPSDVQAIGVVPASGTLRLEVPADRYDVFVSHGPAYSVFPDSATLRGHAVDVTTNSATIEAVVAQVIDTSGWVNADLHVHSAGSARVESLAAEGVDVVMTGENDRVVNASQWVAALGLADTVTTISGAEVSPFDTGHVQIFPATTAVDWAGGDGPALRFDELFAKAKESNAGAIVQLNHPRSTRAAALSTLKVNTARGSTSAAPAAFSMAPHPAATAEDTKLFSGDFDAMEVMTGGAVNLAATNDWLTFLSRGWVKTATGSSDAHALESSTSGLSRTWVRLGADAPIARRTATAFAAAIKRREAFTSSGPFIMLTAKRADGTGSTAQIGETLSVPANTAIELTVDVVAPEWMQFDAIELVTHTTGRESRDGVPNAEWPINRVFARRPLNLAALPLEAVPGLNGFSARRVHVTERFTATATADSYFVALVRSSSAVRTLVPFAFREVVCDSDVCRGASDRAEAITNAVLIDADGSGAYDQFPIQQPLTSPGAAARPKQPLTAQSFEAFLRDVLRNE